MKRKLTAVIVLGMLAASLFAGGISIASNTYYTVPVAGWNLTDGSDSSSQIFNPGFVEELEVGYAFDSGIMVSFAAGFGFNSQKQTANGVFRLYDVPVAINAKFPFATVEALTFYAKVGAGADFRLNFTDKKIYLGPMASVALGADINIVKGLSIGLMTKLNVTTELVGGKELDLYYVPFALNVRYQF